MFEAIRGVSGGHFGGVLGPFERKNVHKPITTTTYSIVWKKNPRFLTRFLGFGIFLGRILGDFWRISGVIFGGFLGTF